MIIPSNLKMRCIQRRTLMKGFALSIFFANMVILLKILFASSNEGDTHLTKEFGFDSNGHQKVIIRSERKVKMSSRQLNVGQNHKTDQNITELHKTELGDIFISVKTTAKNHFTRLKVLLDTWIQLAINQTFIFTDSDDAELQKMLPDGHVLNTNCSSEHTRRALCCKMALEYDIYMNTNKRWFCHVDDDTYLNIHRLVNVLQRYNHTFDWYLGKPSLKHPIEIEDRVNPGQKLAFWFATGGAGFCISHALAIKMIPYAGGGKLMTAGDQIRLPDDCTIGYIIDYVLHKKLTVIEEFHSHLEALHQIRQKVIGDQITLSYYQDSERTNLININGFSREKDPTRFYSLHCHLNPYLEICVQ